MLNFFLLEIKARATPAAEIKAYVNKQQSEQLSLLEKLVNINSSTSSTTNIVGVHQIGEILRPFFEKLGFKAYWVEAPSYIKCAGTLVAELNIPEKILLIGHLDTVFAKTSPFQKFNVMAIK